MTHDRIVAFSRAAHPITIKKEREMKHDTISIARRAYQAYVDSDRAAIEAVIGDDFHFTSPRDNRINRATYFEKYWKNSAARFTFVNLVADGERVFVTYEGQCSSGKPFRNTEILTVRNDKIVEAEVYFGWSIPHDAPAGGFTT
jgi:ketosteroid isomerase-like protein